MRFFIKLVLIAATIFFIVLPLWNLAGSGENMLSDEEGLVELGKLVIGLVVVCPGWFFYRLTNR